VVAYLLTLKQGETTLAEIYVSQLGQVLTAKTLTVTTSPPKTSRPHDADS